MPRSSGSFTQPRSFSSFRQTTPQSITRPSVPALPRPTPAPLQIQAPQPTLGQSMKEGFGLGVGLSVARNVVDRAFGAVLPGGASAPAVASAPVATPTPQPTPTVDSVLYDMCKANTQCRGLSEADRQAWALCMKESKFDAKACQHHFDME
jgi:hypothetical protein